MFKECVLIGHVFVPLHSVEHLAQQPASEVIGSDGGDVSIFHSHGLDAQGGEYKRSILPELTGRGKDAYYYALGVYPYDPAVKRLWIVFQYWPLDSLGAAFLSLAAQNGAQSIQNATSS